MIRGLILKWAQSRHPDFIIGGEDDPYLKRHFLIPRNPVFNIYVHQFLRSDDDRALHDHPWLFNCSILLDGDYIEHTPKGKFLREAGEWKFRFGGAPHRVELIELGPVLEIDLPLTILPCWTVFITGPRVREWGFHCLRGWVHWKEFTDSRDSGKVGRGCD